MSRLLAEVEKLNKRLRDDAFLGKGTIAVTDIRSLSPSLCAVPGACSIHLDRRLTTGETKESAVAEVKALAGAEGAEVEILNYEVPATRVSATRWKSTIPRGCSRNHPLVQRGVSGL